MLAEVFFYGIVIYLIYKVVFDFIVPVSHVGKQMKQQFRNMHENVPAGILSARSLADKIQKVVGDYIDFEEVKK